MKPLEARKQLLLAESEINREQLMQEWQAIADGVNSVADRARRVRDVALGAASLISGLVSSRRTKSATAGEKLPWWQTLLKGAQLVWSLWVESNPRSRS